MSVEIFVEQARMYCVFVSRMAAMPVEERLARTRVRLLALYAAALEISAGQGDDLEHLPSPAVPSIGSGFEDHDVYWEVFDPYEQSDAICGTLSDDVLDIYRDVKRGLELWDRGRREEAMWEWRFNFEIHWGEHAVDALRALHRACKVW